MRAPQSNANQVTTNLTDAIGIVTGTNHRMQWGITMRPVIHWNKSPD